MYTCKKQEQEMDFRLNSELYRATAFKRLSSYAKAKLVNILHNSIYGDTGVSLVVVLLCGFSLLSLLLYNVFVNQ